MTQAKRGRPPRTLYFDQLIENIKNGELDDRIGELKEAIQLRTTKRQMEVLERVREVFGPDAEITTMRERGFISERRNPFEDKAKEREAASNSESASREPLPGPYRRDPRDGNSYRVDSEEDKLVWITDIFGSHRSSVLKTMWESWPEIPDPDDKIIEDDLAGLDDVERKMVQEDRGAEVTQTPQVPENYIPPERRGATISGMHSSMMGN